MDKFNCDFAAQRINLTNQLSVDLKINLLHCDLNLVKYVTNVYEEV